MRTVSTDRLLGIALLLSFFGMMIAAHFTPDTPDMCKSSTTAEGVALAFICVWCALTGYIGARMIVDPS